MNDTLVLRRIGLCDMSHCEGEGYSNSTSAVYSSPLYRSVTTTILPETKKLKVNGADNKNDW